MARESGGIYGTSGTIASSRSRLNKFNISGKKAIICDTLSMPLGSDLSGSFTPTASLPIRYDAVDTSGTAVSPNGGYTLIANTFDENTYTTSASGNESTNSAQLVGTTTSIAARADTFIENVNHYIIAATGHTRIIGYTSPVVTPAATSDSSAATSVMQSNAKTGPAYYITESTTGWPSSANTTTMYVTCDFGYKPSLTSCSGYSSNTTAYASNQYKTTLGSLTSSSEEVTTGVKTLTAETTGWSAPILQGFQTATYINGSDTEWFIKFQVYNPNSTALYCHYYARSSADISATLTHMVTQIAARSTDETGWLYIGFVRGDSASTDWADIDYPAYIPPLFFSSVSSTYRSAIYDTSPATFVVIDDNLVSSASYYSYGTTFPVFRSSEAYDLGREVDLYTDQQYSSSDDWYVIN